MKAVVLPQPGTISVERVDDPAPAADGVVVAPGRGNLCENLDSIGMLHALITHRLSLDDYASAVDAFRRGEGLKIQIAPSG